MTDALLAPATLDVTDVAPAAPTVPLVPYVHLRAAGVSLLLDLTEGRLPAVRHWGADLGDLSDAELAAVAEASEPPRSDSPMDVVERTVVMPEHASAWLGRPGLAGSRGGRDWSAVFRVAAVEQGRQSDGTAWLRAAASDPTARLRLAFELELVSAGLVRMRATLTNDDAAPYAVDALRLVLPVPAQATELADFTGRHTMERVLQRQPYTMGVHSRESRLGRPGLDSAYVLMAGEPGFGYRHGEVWGLHLGWSGNHNIYAEQLPNGVRVLGAAELLESDEVVLAEGEAYRTPWVYAAYGVGTDALAERFHRHLRSRPGHPRTPRPVLLNTWEAVYFDHRLDKLTALADRAAEIGVERFVLDDGWFADRRDDHRSLGDWRVSPQLWPDGLGPLVSYVRARGMQFGLWVEPEMVNLDSDLARAHPEWLFSAGGRVGLASRQQHVLDLGHPGAYAHIRDSLEALLTSYDIAYLKWDHNRNLLDAGHTPDGTPGVHRHTLALYRLLEELHAAHPGLEIESCAGGGGRVDLGIVDRTERIWPSDCIDALERQQIQRGTQLLLPPELLGTHVGSERAHTTHRRHGLGFRAATALWGHLGIEWDLTLLSAAELTELAGWISLHKRHRQLLHTGTVVNVDHPDPAFAIHGVVAADTRSALFEVTLLRRTHHWPPGRMRLAGLDPDLAYTVTLAHPVGPRAVTSSLPAWARTGLTLPGRALAAAGVEMLPIHPETSYLLHLTAEA